MRINDKKGLKALGFIGLMLLFPVSTFAQSGNTEATTVVTGIVTDAALGTPMVGVRVQAYNNRSHSAMTKEDGSYTIKVPEYVTSLVFSVEGCNTAVAALNGRTDGVDVKLYSDAFSETYQTKTIASTQKVMGTSMLNADISIDNQMQQGLMGDILSVSRSGQIGVGNLSFIDGINSLNINTQPLIVLDGVILDMGYDRLSMHDGFYNNVLANIMPDDIESISVLKNGLAVYGAKGANGVIIIKTKRNRSMATRIDVSLSGEYQMMPKFPSMMNASQYRNYVSELLGTTGTKMNSFKFMSVDPQYLYYNKYHNDTNWTDVAYQNSFVQNYSVNVDGGDEIAKYTLSVGYAKGDAILKESDYSRFNLRLNSDIILSDKLSLRFDACYSDVTRDMRDDGAIDNIDDNMITAPTFLSLAKSPFLSPYAFAYSGAISHYLAGADDYLDEVLGDEVSLSNPQSILENGDGINKNYFGNRLITLAVTPKWEINPRWSVNEHFCYTLINSDENYYIPLTGSPTFDIEGIGTVENKAAAMNSKQDGFMSNTYVEFAKRFKAHDVNFQAGVRYMNNTLYQTAMAGYNSGNDKTPNMTSSLKYKTTDGIDTQDISITWYGQGNYNYMEKYYLSAGLGLSASSRFGGNVSNGLTMFKVPWGLFPSVQGAWVASSEDWFDTSFVNYLKINAGFDITGNDGFDDSASKTYFSPVKVLQMSGTAIANIGNSSLQWETTAKMTAGIDLSLADNRVRLSADFFKSNTNNLLSVSSLSYRTGLPDTWSNGGSLSNKGFNATLIGKLVNTDMVKWELGASAGKYVTEITKLPDNDKAIDTKLYGATIRTAVGGPIGVFMGYQTDGVFSTSADATAAGLYMLSDTQQKTYFEAGDMKFVDQNGDKIINEKDLVEIGNPNPDLYGRIFTNLNVKNFTLSATLTYSLGGDVYNYQRMLLESGSRFMNQTVAVTNHWTCEGQQTTMPKVIFEDPHGNSRFSDRWIEDGSYLRLKNVTLSYKIPIISTYLQGLTIWGSANNIVTLSNYLGSDPEFAAGNDAHLMGIDRGLAPQTPSFSFGLKINL